MVFAAGALFAGCDQTDAEGGYQSCQTFCDQLELCDDHTDLSGCLDDCRAQAFHSDAYFQVRADCAQRMSCNRWASEVDSSGRDLCSGDCALIDCVDDALGSERVAATTKSACLEVAGALVDCDRSLDLGAVAERCQQAYPELSDAYVAESRQCIQGRCREIVSCLADLADRYDTKLRLFSGDLAL